MINIRTDFTIRESTHKDIKIMVDIWYKASVISHDFIPLAYWQENIEAMETIYLPSSENYVIIKSGEIIGFVALINQYLASIFISPENQRMGVGKELMKFVKSIRNNLELKVYCKNEPTVQFYKSQGFSIIDNSIDDSTGEKEYVMQWIINN
ncbi:putative acetyltransferase [Chishuiella changwenlii]|uniref:N-acetyltransferase n=1 Tax=Chishuiella changwenlii TaxID=1434701 RepID=A0A1M6XDA6_9FLAO|nr:N-acetyltransferase [Chishuiella changwenlii]GGF00492.1 N-acetyltransferase [Chishuiella changwenlii]SHL03936.1 putative acetyltransferase [Chishuiella changwenlii]